LPAVATYGARRRARRLGQPCPGRVRDADVRGESPRHPL